MKGNLKRLLSTSLACVMLLALLPAGALAAEETAGAVLLTDTAAPTITGLSVNGVTASADQNGSLIASVTADTALAGKAFSLVTSEAVTFVADNDPATGSLYVTSASANAVTLAFALGDNEDNYSISMTSTDGITWTGSFSSSFALTMGGLGDALSTANATLAAGSMVSTTTQTGSTAYRLYCNQDAVNAQLIVCPANVVMYTVTYNVSYGDDAESTILNWTVPTGAALTEPTLSLLSTQTLSDWYYDTDYTNIVTFGTAVTGNLTLYASVTTTASGTFAQDFANEETTLTIKTDEDWASFISLASQISSTQLVVLDKDIDCGGATYTTLTFAGNFNGKNHIISNATFSAVDGYSGMFKTIGPDQKVCNLVLNNVTAKYASTYSGILAGSISGTEGHNALVQNVQVWGGTASGRSAGGIAGFIFFADVKYCGSYNTTITGVANGGGIGGISYGFITQCYSVSNPTALLSS
ncbi:MAG: InlB B-repeat-containing protein, partial [Oscillospiraceae bacterium]